MKTNDLVKMGMERHFLRQCEENNLITPIKTDGKYIINKNYKPREYTEKDVQTLWSIYLYKKIGLTYDEIKKLLNGEEICMRNSMNKLIVKYEKEIEELKLLVELMKIIKGIGIIPSPPESVKIISFVDYIKNFIKPITQNNSVMKAMDIMGYLSNLDLEKENIENLLQIKYDKDETLEQAIDNLKKVDFLISSEKLEEFSIILLSLKDKLQESPSSKNIQEIIDSLFNLYKDIINKKQLTRWEFLGYQFYLMDINSDLGVLNRKIFGNDVIEFYEEALIQYTIKHYPDRIEKLKKEI